MFRYLFEYGLLYICVINQFLQKIKSYATMRKLIHFNTTEILNHSILSVLKGGKRSSAAYQNAEAAILAKAGRRVNRQLSNQSGSVSFFYDGQNYTANYDTITNMLHVTGANGLDICVEW
jgi:hypothetical protein